MEVSGRASWKSTEIGLFLLFRRVWRAPVISILPQISSDLLKPPFLKPLFAALQGWSGKCQEIRGFWISTENGAAAKGVAQKGSSGA